MMKLILALFALPIVALAQGSTNDYLFYQKPATGPLVPRAVTPTVGRLLGWPSSINTPAAITLGTGLSLAGSTLNATASSAWADITGTPTTLAGYGITAPAAATFSGITGITAGANDGGSGGVVYLRGGQGAGVSPFNLPGGNSGFLDLRGGNGFADGGGGGGVGGNAGTITAKGGNGSDGANGGTGGAIQISGGDGAADGTASGGNAGILIMDGGLSPGGGVAGNAGGSIYTNNGGGSIDTRGTGSIQFGALGTRTTLVGSAATTDKTITMPNATGTILLTDGNGSALTALNASNISSGSLALARIEQAGATSGQAIAWNGTAWAPATIASGLTIGTTAITGGTSGRLLTSGTTVGELTLGTGVSTFLGTPTLANLNTAVSDADLATTGANTFTGTQTLSAITGGTSSAVTITGNDASGGVLIFRNPNSFTGTTANLTVAGGGTMTLGGCFQVLTGNSIGGVCESGNSAIFVRLRATGTEQSIYASSNTLTMGISTATNGATATAHTLKAPNATGTTSTGGSLTLAGGTGSSAGGAVIISTAATTTQATAVTVNKDGVTTFAKPPVLPVYTVATLPATAAAGMVQGAHAVVTDATAPTYLGALTGGGAIVCPVFYNGTAWVSH